MKRGVFISILCVVLMIPVLAWAPPGGNNGGGNTKTIDPADIQPQGSGSGLDADLLDGRNSSEFASTWRLDDLSNDVQDNYNLATNNYNRLQNITGPKYGVYPINPLDFKPYWTSCYDSTVKFRMNTIYVSNNESGGCIHWNAPVHIPQDCTILSFNVTYLDADPDPDGWIRTYLIKHAKVIGSTDFIQTTIGYVDSNDSDPPVFIIGTDNNIFDPVVNNVNI